MSGRQILVQPRARCHNPRLDQNLTRAKFDGTRLDEMSAVRHMPPAVFRDMPDAIALRMAARSDRAVDRGDVRRSGSSSLPWQRAKSRNLQADRSERPSWMRDGVRKNGWNA